MKLNKYRDEIDQLDQEIIHLLDQRLEIVKQVGEYKRENQLAVLDQGREIKIYTKIDQQNLKNPDEIKAIYQEMLKITKGMQWINMD